MRPQTILVSFRFYSELNDLLPPERRYRRFEVSATSSDSVKHLVEALGVPHTEVDLVVVNSDIVSWERHLSSGDQVSVYPMFCALKPGPASLLPPPMADPRFVLDGHLGRLAAYLRMLGFDTICDRRVDDEQLAKMSETEDRILLTRDTGLLKRRGVMRGHLVRSDDPKQQLRDVTLRFDLAEKIVPFSRCMECNQPLEPASKEQIQHRLPPHTRATKEEFSECRACGKLYWKGSHHSEMTLRIEELRRRTR